MRSVQENNDINKKFFLHSLENFRSEYNTIFEYNKDIGTFFKNMEISDITNLEKNIIQLERLENLLKEYLSTLEQYSIRYFVLGDIKGSIKNFCLELKACKNILQSFDYYCKHQIFIPTIISKKYYTTQEESLTYKKGLPDWIKNDVIKGYRQFGICYVSGMKNINPYYHALLYIESIGFFHVDKLIDFPTHLTIEQFNGYIIREKKKFFGINFFELKNSENAITALDRLVREKWTWGGPVHNCFTFARTILEAGGCQLNNDIDFFKRFGIELPKQFYQATSEKKFMHWNSNNASTISPEEIIKNTHFSKLDLDTLTCSQKISLAEYILQNFIDVCSNQEKKFYNNRAAANNIDEEDFLVLLPESNEHKACREVAKKLADMIANTVNHKHRDSITVENDDFLNGIKEFLEYLKNLQAAYEKSDDAEKAYVTFFDPTMIAEDIKKIFNDIKKDAITHRLQIGL